MATTTGHTPAAASARRRNTPQRAAIRALFRHDSRPLSVVEILDRAQEQIPGLNQATVYRTVSMLLEDGWLTRITHSEVGALYERSGKEHHHHFYCRGCTRVFELPGCPLPGGVQTPPGFAAEGHELFLRGLCAGCNGRSTVAGTENVPRTIRRGTGGDRA